MNKRNHRLSKACAHAGYKETAFWDCSSWEEYNRIAADNREWKCLRHAHPEQVLSATNFTFKTLIVVQKEHGRYFDGHSGFLSGPGFMAYAADFPPGTKLTVTTSIELPASPPEQPIMSDGNKIPLHAAKLIADAVMKKLHMATLPGCAIVGSIRREKPEVGDIELLAPLPLTEIDWLFQAIGSAFLTHEDEGTMFPREGTFGKVVKGWKPGFAYCQLLARVPSYPDVKVDIFRYTAGPQGNRGWIELMRTGSAEFSESVLTEWKRVCGTIGTPKPGSKDGFLIDSMGNRRYTPDEASVFKLIGREPVAPRDRSAAIQGANR